MSYDNAEPKILKTLNSSGQVLDDTGNVISETSDYWVRTYNQAEPKVDKILHSDGTIKDSAGNLIQDVTEFNIKKYNQAEPIPAKYLHADGTVDENAGGAGANLEDDKEVEITENGEIEITPSSGYDGMKKVTATVNVSGGGATPSTEMPSWFNDYENSIVPSGVQIVGVTRNSSGTIILTGDGQNSITGLLTDGKVFHEELVSYGESIVFAYDEPM